MLDPAFKHVFWCCGSPWKGEWKSDSGVIKRGHCNVHQVPHCAPLTSLRTASTSGLTDSIKPSLLKVSKGEKNMLDWGHWKIEERAWSQWQQRFALPCTSWLYTLEQTLPFFFHSCGPHLSRWPISTVTATFWLLTGRQSFRRFFTRNVSYNDGEMPQAVAASVMQWLCS